MISIKYGHDDFVIIEETHGTMDCRYRARQRDGTCCGFGDTPREAIQSLAHNMRREADDIEQAAARDSI